LYSRVPMLGAPLAVDPILIRIVVPTARRLKAHDGVVIKPNRLDWGALWRHGMGSSGPEEYPFWACGPTKSVPGNIKAAQPGCAKPSLRSSLAKRQHQVDGELAPGWLIGNGYAYNLYATGTPDLPPDLPVTSTPRHLETGRGLSGTLRFLGQLAAQTQEP
jgi:hypothetical protein